MTFFNCLATDEHVEAIESIDHSDFFSPLNSNKYMYFPYTCLLNPFPNDRILDMTKSKVFADDKLNVANMVI